MNLKSLILLLALLLPFAARAEGFEYDYSAQFRVVPGYTMHNALSKSLQRKFHAPSLGETKGTLRWNVNADTYVELDGLLQGQSGTNLDNLNQGNWGENIHIALVSRYGEFSAGQLNNVAIQFGINRANIAIWQPTPSDFANYIANPNWQQKKHNKYYNTLTSTLMNTDGSALKFNYITPEFAGTVMGLSFIPENNANDGLTSKFSPYRNKEGYVATLYNSHGFSFAETEAYFSFAEYVKSHREYAAGFSVYRKGLTFFASYRQTETSGSDYKITKQNLSSSQPAFYDGFRRGIAWNAGLSYETIFVTSTLSYFESFSRDTPARNQIVNWHNSLKMHKNWAWYIGAAYIDFKSNSDNINADNHGLAAYTGIQFSF